MGQKCVSASFIHQRVFAKKRWIGLRADKGKKRKESHNTFVHTKFWGQLGNVT
jgi:hypothetical protein